VSVIVTTVLTAFSYRLLLLGHIQFS